MIRGLLLLLAAPLWLPWRLIAWLRARAGARPTLYLVLSGSLPDLPSNAGLMGLLRRASGHALAGVLDTLDNAARDPKIETVLVRIENLECGLGRADELRAALARVVSAGKRVIVYADELGLSGFWVALGASSIRLAPSGALNVSGVAMQFTLLKGLLDRAGVRAQLLARGKYKSMREMFAAPAISDANREMLTSLVEDLSSQLQNLIAAARKQTPELAKARLDSGPFRADEAIANGLCDMTQYWDQLWDELGGEKDQVQTFDVYAKRQRRKRFWPVRPTRVALVRITGNIRSGHDRPGRSGPRATGHQSLRRTLQQVAKSARIRAIVVRVDSPGGSALASDLMWRELTLASQKKPMFVSMVNVAASGGYYTSGLKGVPVWANPSTLTGSIGVVGGKFEVSELLAKVGITTATVASGPRANFYAIDTPWSEAELQKVDRDIDASYREFVTKMADARNLSYEALDAVAQGRVWTGQQARENALVDHLGGLHEVEIALRKQLELPSDSPIKWAAPSSRRGLLGRGESESEALVDRARALFHAVPELGDALERALDLRGDRLLALSVIHPKWSDR